MSFEQVALVEHNKHRIKHHAPMLTLSKDLCSFAQEWADHLAQTGQLAHRPNNKYGENVYMKGGTGSTINGKEPVDSWYNEVKNYHYYGQEPPPMSLGTTGHFTQVVWKSSKKLGIAKAQQGNNIFVVANYDPHGNVSGQYAENVLSP